MYFWRQEARNFIGRETLAEVFSRTSTEHVQATAYVQELSCTDIFLSKLLSPKNIFSESSLEQSTILILKQFNNWFLWLSMIVVFCKVNTSRLRENTSRAKYSRMDQIKFVKDSL